MKRWLIHVLVLSIGLLLLSGCITQQTVTTVNNNGSGTNEILFGFTRDVVEQMQQDGEDPFADFRAETEDMPADWNAQVVAWEDETYVGMKIVLSFANLEMLDAQLERVLGAEADTNTGSSTTGLFESFDVRQEGNTVIIGGLMKQDEDSSGAEGMPPELFADFKISWSVALPQVESYTEEGIATREGNRVTWTFPFVAERDYNVEIRGTLDGSGAVSSGNSEPVTQPATLPGERCFAEVPYCITGRIRQYWEENGGLQVFGFPITAQQEEVIEGQTLQLQWFERNRLELHPENAPPYDVLLGRLGVDVLEKQGRNWQSFPKDEAQDGCLYFADTGHNICGDVLTAWQANGLELDGVAGFSQQESTALFGLPVSGLVEETLSDGNTYMVQYFERARFELHPENAPPYNVLFGLLGKEMKDEVQRMRF